MIKNSFDQWKGKIAEPFDQVKSAEIIDFNTNLTTKAAQVPLIIEEENKQE